MEFNGGPTTHGQKSETSSNIWKYKSQVWSRLSLSVEVFNIQDPGISVTNLHTLSASKLPNCSSLIFLYLGMVLVENKIGLFELFLQHSPYLGFQPRA